MTSKKRLLELYEKCLDEMYKESVPSITWEQYKEKYGGTDIQGFKYHYLSNERFKEIGDKYLKKINKKDRPSFMMSLVDLSPTCSEKQWKIDTKEKLKEKK